MDRRTRIVSRKNHINRQLHAPCHISIAQLNQLNLCHLVEGFSPKINLFISQHLKVDRSDWRLYRVKYETSQQIIWKLDYLWLQLSSYLKFVSFGRLVLDVFTFDYKIFWFRILEFMDYFTPWIRNLKIEGHLRL